MVKVKWQKKKQRPRDHRKANFLAPGQSRSIVGGMVRSAHILMACVVALLGFGVLMTHSAGMRIGGVPDPMLWGDGPEPVARWGITAALGGLAGRNLLYAALAIGAMLFASRINVRQMFVSRGLRNPLFLITLLALGLSAATLVPGWGKSVNGASRWLQVGPPGMGFSFQPSELVKWVMILTIAWWCARRRGVMHRFGHGLIPPVLLMALACGLIVIEDLGTAMLIGLVAVCMLLAGGARLWQLALGIPPAVAVLIAAVLHSPYRMQRILTFLDPWADPAGSGYHPIQSMLAFAQGGLWGVGLGNSVQKYHLPEDTTDFIFPILAEELGLPGAGTVILLYIAVLWIGLGIIKDCRDVFGRLVGLGVLLTLGLQTTVNLAVVTVVAPTKGIALPLISAGGTGWVLTAFALGLVAALDNANHLIAVEGQAPVASDAESVQEEEDPFEEAPASAGSMTPLTGDGPVWRGAMTT